MCGLMLSLLPSKAQIAPVKPDEWKNAVQSKFYRPRKEATSLIVDSDVLHWLRSQGVDYQTRMNQVLRVAINAAIEQKKKP